MSFSGLQKYFPLFFLGAIWLGLILLIDPRGDFPLNDDWSYGLNVKALVEEQRWFFSNWPAMSLVVHTLWGSAFCVIFGGFSFTVLRFSVLLLSIAACCGLYVLVKRSGISSFATTLTVLALLFFPHYLVLSFSFMTDISFLAFLLLGFLAYTRLLDTTASVSYWIIPLILGIAATLIRQIGLILPLSFGVVYFLRNKKSFATLLGASLPFLLTGFSLWSFTQWQASQFSLPDTYAGPDQLLRPFREGVFLHQFADRTGMSLFYLGWLLLPFSLPAIFRDWISSNWLQRSWRIGMGLLGIVLVARIWNEVPYPNVFYNLGLGPTTVKDAYWQTNNAYQLSTAAWDYFVRFPGLIGAGLLLAGLFTKGVASFRHQSTIWWLALAVACAYQGFIVLEHFFFDRHLLPLFPFVLILWWGGRKPPSRLRLGVSGLLLLPIALFSLLATHDYLAWNRARWKGLTLLQERQIPPEKIDGGFEFNGWYQTNQGKRNPEWRNSKSWWFVEDDEWLVTFGEYCDYKPQFKLPYKRWLTGQSDTIFIQRRRLIRDTIQANQFNQTEILYKERPFAFTHTYSSVRACDQFKAQVWRYPADGSGGIVFAVPDQADNHYFESQNIIATDSLGNGLLEFQLTLPLTAEFDQLKCYLWQPGQDSVRYRNFKVMQLR